MTLVSNHSEHHKRELFSFLMAINADLEAPKIRRIPSVEELLSGIDSVEIAPTLIQPKVNFPIIKNYIHFEPTIRSKPITNEDTIMQTQRSPAVQSYRPIHPKTNLAPLSDHSATEQKTNKQQKVLTYVVGTLGLVAMLLLITTLILSQ